MRKLILGLPLAIAAAVAIPTLGHAKANRTDKRETAGSSALNKDEQQKLREHLRLKEHISKHVTYPATKQEILKACKGVSEVKASDRKWFEETLPDRTYDSADEVEKALGWEASKKL